MKSESKSYALPIAMMFALFFMIAFVTNFAGSMGVIVQNQFGASNAMSQLGTLANFIAYACMGIPAGLILKRKGYKFTSLLAITNWFYWSRYTIFIRICSIIPYICNRCFCIRIFYVYA